jgi:predicted transcriptional regulator
MEHLPESPTSGAVRRMLNLLYAKDLVEYRHKGAKKVYQARIKRDVAGVRALKHVAETFFAGSAARTMASLFRSTDPELSAEEKKALLELIDKAKEKGR